MICSKKNSQFEHQKEQQKYLKMSILFASISKTQSSNRGGEGGSNTSNTPNGAESTKTLLEYFSLEIKGNNLSEITRVIQGICRLLENSLGTLVFAYYIFRPLDGEDTVFMMFLCCYYASSVGGFLLISYLLPITISTLISTLLLTLISTVIPCRKDT